MSHLLLAIVVPLVLGLGILVWVLREPPAGARGKRDVPPATPSRVSISAIDALAESPGTLPKITWPFLLDEHSGDLSTDGRFELVQRLGVIADEWTTPILRQAVHEENDPRILDALVDALVAKRLQ